MLVCSECGGFLSKHDKVCFSVGQVRILMLVMWEGGPLQSFDGTPLILTILHLIKRKLGFKIFIQTKNPPSSHEPCRSRSHPNPEPPLFESTDTLWRDVINTNTNFYWMTSSSAAYKVVLGLIFIFHSYKLFRSLKEVGAD